MNKIQIKENKDLGETISIDFGTSSIYMGYINEKERHILKNKNGDLYFASFVAFDQNNKLYIGHEAYSKDDYKKIEIKSIKRTLGQTSKTIKDSENFLGSCEIDYSRSNDYIYFKLFNGKSISNLEIITEIFKRLKSEANLAISDIKNSDEVSVDKAILTHPVYFNERAKAELKFCAEQAGFNVVKMMPEPVASIYAHDWSEGRYLVFDLGAGTYDLSVIDIHKNIYRCIANSGDRYLGGDDVDIILAKYLKKKYPDLFHENEDRFCHEAVAFARYVKEGAKNTKYISQYLIDKECKDISYAEMNKELEPFISKLIRILDKMLIENNIEKSTIKNLIFVGGSTRLEPIEKAVKSKFLEAKSYENEDAPFFSRESQVAIGAIQYLRSQKPLIQVCPLSLGIELMGGVVEKIIERNTSLPIVEKRIFSNYSKDQNKIIINILEGERDLVQYCKSLGKFEIDIPRAIPGTVKVEVSFSLDFDGELLVVAKVEDRKTFFKYEPFKNLSLEDIKKEIESSISNHSKDLAEKELAENIAKANILINNLENLILLNEKFGSLEIKAHINNLKQALHSRNLDEINDIMSRINNLLKEIVDSN